jgi:hypothetical protein
MMHHPATRRHAGFTRADLATVLGMGFLLLLVGACSVQRVREDGARVHCQNNLKQIALAIHDYASTYNNALPDLSGAVRQDNAALPAIMTVHPQSILFTILPFVEAENLYKPGMIGSNGVPVADNSTGQPPGTTPPVYSTGKESVCDTWAQSITAGPIYRCGFIKTYWCPADSSNSVERTIEATGWVGSSYAANVTVFGTAVRPDITVGNGGGAFTIYGAIYNIGNIPDGTSNTVGIAERFAYTMNETGTAIQACMWAYPPSQNLPIFGSDNKILNGPVFGIVAGANVPAMNSGGAYGSAVPDTIAPDAYSVGAKNPDPTGTYFLPEIGRAPTTSINAAFGAVASQHPAVVQVAMMDGSARGITSAVSELTWNRAVEANDAAALGTDW